MASVSSGNGNWLDFINDTNKMYQGAVNNITEPISAASVNDRDYNAMREDTQYQRLVNDLTAAGLNKWLAVNGSAQPSAQAISNTAEGRSRAAEIGFKYQDLLNKTLQFAEKQLQAGGKDIFDKLWKLAEKGFGFALIS